MLAMPSLPTWYLQDVYFHYIVHKMPEIISTVEPLNISIEIHAGLLIDGTGETLALVRLWCEAALDVVMATLSRPGPTLSTN